MSNDKYTYQCVNADKVRKGFEIHESDQLRKAKVEVLREAATTVLARYFAHDAANYLDRMADELGKQP